MTEADPLPEMHQQNDYLRQQLHALARGTAARRRKFLLVVVRCGRCEDVLLEVVDTFPYPVVRHRGTEAHPSAAVFGGGSVQERLAHDRSVGEPIRRGEWLFCPLPSPIPDVGDGETVIHTACRCRQVAFTEAQLFPWVHAPDAVKVVHPPR